MRQTIITVSADHVDLVSSKDFETTVADLAAQLGRSSTQELMDRLAAAMAWDDYAAQCDALSGPSGLVGVGTLDWGAMLSLSGIPTKARCFIIGNPATAQKLLSAGGPQLGLYLPTRILVYEDKEGWVHVAYDRLPLMAPSQGSGLSAIASAIDQHLQDLAHAATG